MENEKRKFKHYSKEFKAEAVRLVLDEGLKQAQVARDLGVSATVMSGWVRKWKADGKDAFPGKGKLKPHDEEVRKLQRKLRIVEMERDILKKTIGYFAEVPK